MREPTPVRWGNLRGSLTQTARRRRSVRTIDESRRDPAARPIGRLSHSPSSELDTNETRDSRHSQSLRRTREDTEDTEDTIRYAASRGDSSRSESLEKPLESRRSSCVSEARSLRYSEISRRPTAPTFAHLVVFFFFSQGLERRRLSGAASAGSDRFMKRAGSHTISETPSAQSQSETQDSAEREREEERERRRTAYDLRPRVWRKRSPAKTDPRPAHPIAVRDTSSRRSLIKRHTGPLLDESLFAFSREKAQLEGFFAPTSRRARRSRWRKCLRKCSAPESSKPGTWQHTHAFRAISSKERPLRFQRDMRGAESSPRRGRAGCIA